MATHSSVLPGESSELVGLQSIGSQRAGGEPLPPHPVFLQGSSLTTFVSIPPDEGS